MNIVITGSVAYDYLMTFPGYFRDHILPEHIERISLSFLVDSMVRQRGGVASNIAYGLALFGRHPHLMATVGEDFGDYRTWLEAHGVDTCATKVIPDEFTASFFANTDQANSQICSFYTGAMAHAAELSFRDLKEKPDLVVISPNDPLAMVQYPKECKELGISYLYDPSQQLPRLNGDQLREGIEGAWALFVNDYEFNLIQDKTGLSEADIFKDVHLLVITHGEKGSAIFVDGTQHVIPVVPPKSIADPTGVGDAFRSGFLAGYSLGLNWKLCGEMGSLSATYCLENTGTQGYAFSLPQFITRFRENFDDLGALDVFTPG